MACSSWRREAAVDVPLVLFSYLNPIVAAGPTCARARGGGRDSRTARHRSSRGRRPERRARDRRVAARVHPPRRADHADAAHGGDRAARQRLRVSHQPARRDRNAERDRERTRRARSSACASATKLPVCVGFGISGPGAGGGGGARSPTAWWSGARSCARRETSVESRGVARALDAQGDRRALSARADQVSRSRRSTRSSGFTKIVSDSLHEHRARARHPSPCARICDASSPRARAPSRATCCATRRAPLPPRDRATAAAHRATSAARRARRQHRARAATHRAARTRER